MHAAAALLLLWLALPAGAEPRRENGFLLDSQRIDVAEIQAGGPERDAIPALTDPVHVPAADSPWDSDEVVIGVALGGEARAYPLSILVWHELVNDRLGGVPILVSYCPLCGTGVVFDRRGPHGVRSFGVSGLLYRSDQLLYDRESESLWSQISAEAVITAETGHRRLYGTWPYGDYAQSERLLYPVPYDTRYHPKSPTLGLRGPEGAVRAYLAQEIVAAGGRVEEEFGGGRVVVRYDPEAQYFDFQVPDGVEAIEGFWFAWSAFHPETGVYTAPDPPRPDQNPGS
jgi:hypothetical protein